ncbi:MAG: hypothetical protein ACXAEL_12870 [Candidatus Hodarchaeales archaeon]
MKKGFLISGVSLQSSLMFFPALGDSLKHQTFTPLFVAKKLANEWSIEAQTMDKRTEALQRQIRDFGVWTGTTIQAWAIFDENGLALFLEGEGYLGNLEMALGAIASQIDDLVRESDNYDLNIRLASLELKTRDKLHYFRMGEWALVIITAFNIRGEEEFLANVTKYIERLHRKIS